MSKILTGQLSVLDLLEPIAPPKPTAPPFTVNLYPWQARGCGWCGKPGTSGGAATRHPEHHQISIYYEYCEKCWTRYGDPARSDTWPRFLVNEDPGTEAEKKPQILERIATWRTLTTKGKS